MSNLKNIKFEKIKKQAAAGLEPSIIRLQGRRFAIRPTRLNIMKLLHVMHYKPLSKVRLTYFVTRSYGKMPLCAMADLQKQGKHRKKIAAFQKVCKNWFLHLYLDIGVDTVVQRQNFLKLSKR